MYHFATVKPLILQAKQTIMKKIIFIAIITAFFAGCSGKTTSTENAGKVAAVANKTVTLAIEGMTCTGCENTIQESVTKIAGVTAIKASHLDSTAVVSFDSTLTTVNAIGDAVTEAGYVFKGEKAVAASSDAK